jgi:hypothetical protein
MRLIKPTVQAELLAATTLLALCGCGGNVAVPTGNSSVVATAVQDGPQLGYAWNADDQTLRPILGIAGSSQVGQSVVPAAEYIAAASSSHSGLALLIGSDHQVYRMSLPSGTPAALNIAASAGTQIRFSPSGTAALLFVPGTTSATLITGVTGTVQAKPLTLAAPVSEMATSDAGSVVALVPVSGGAAINVVSSGGSLQPLANLGAGGGVSFVGTSDDVLAADGAANTLTLIHAVSTALSVTQVATANLLKSPVAVGAALGGRWAVVANQADSSVVRVDLTGATPPQRIVCPLQPTMVEQLAGNGVFRFTDIGDTPGWIADVTASTPSMLFIPALPRSATAGSAAAARRNGAGATLASSVRGR